MALHGCCGVIKYLVVLVNLLFWFVGFSIVLLAIWMLTDPSFLISMTQNESNYFIGLYILLVVGGLMLTVAFLGCCGAFKESRCMLLSQNVQIFRFKTISEKLSHLGENSYPARPTRRDHGIFHGNLKSRPKCCTPKPSACRLQMVSMDRVSVDASSTPDTP
uniref:CD9 antigen n=2 Tax=Culex pipiens TaxID=7175 RepID=A0A8D8NCT0_CULPI